MSSRNYLVSGCTGVTIIWEPAARVNGLLWVLGISSAVYKGDNRYQVDGFCHPDHDFFIRLIQTAVNWCKAKKAVEITFNVSKQDKNKENLVRDVGFRTMEGEAYLESGNRKTRTLLYSTG